MTSSKMNKWNHLKQYKIELASVIIAVGVVILKTISPSVTLKTIVVTILLEACVISIKYIYKYMKESKTFYSIRVILRDISDYIDSNVADWIRGMRQRTLDPNSFFDWLLPEVNVNISCVETTLHNRQIHRYKQLPANSWEECFEHKDLLPHDCGPACLFFLANLPNGIKDKIGDLHSSLKSKKTAIEIRDFYHLSEYSVELIGWNVFGLLYNHDNVGSKPIQNTKEACVAYMKITSPSAGSRNKKTVHKEQLGSDSNRPRKLNITRKLTACWDRATSITKQGLEKLFGVEVCVQLDMDDINRSFRKKTGIKYSKFSDRYNSLSIGDYEHNINRPICELMYIEDSALMSKIPNYTSIPPIPSEDYHKLVLSDSLDLDTLENIKHLKKLRVLICDKTKVHDLEPIQDFYLLEKLSLNRTKVANLDPITNFTDLRELYLDDTDVEDLSPIRSLKKLEIIHLSHTKVKDLSPLKDIRRLRQLWCYGTKVSDISPIARKGIEQLNISNTNISDFLPIKTMESLGELIFSLPSCIPPTKRDQIIKSLENLDALVYVSYKGEDRDIREKSMIDTELITDITVKRKRKQLIISPLIDVL